MVAQKLLSWQRKQKRVRRKIQGSPERPRLCVSKSNRYLAVQIIDDVNRVTLASATTQEASVSGGKSIDSAKKLGSLIAERAKSKNIESIVFDRNGYIYHGRVQAIADAAREAGLKF